MNKNKLISAFVVGVILIGMTGCSLWTKGGTDTGGDMIDVVPTEVSEVPTEAIEDVEEPTEAALSEEVATEVVKPTPRGELVATDPGTVNLASGNYQLVEIFAFW